MFTTLTGGSKVAISGLVSLCLSNGVTMLDCQMASEHLTTLGMEEVSREQFLQQLQPRVLPSPDRDWSASRTPAESLSTLR
jgi:leucyl/phenylalanyl-tRNA--protein transferase